MMRMDEMTPRRFRDIVDAYGAQAMHWPEDEREAARAFAAAHPDMVAPWLAQARALDGLLDMADEPVISERLHFQTVARMIAANDITSHMPVTSGSGKFGRVSMLWVTGAGMAACLAGAVLGIQLSLSSLDDMRAQTVLEQAQMIEIIDEMENG